MNAAHWHLVSNHLPIIIPFIGLLIMIFGFLLSSEILKRTAYSLFILGSITAFVAMYTGEEAEDIVEGLWGVDQNYIELHEESAKVFSALLYILGGFSIIGMWASWKSKAFSKGFSIATIVFAIVVLFFGGTTGATGGDIRHTELHTDQAKTAPTLDDNPEDFDEYE